jgi:hypothetical protein
LEVVSRWGLRDDGGTVLDEFEQRFLDENDIERYARMSGVTVVRRVCVWSVAY